MKFWTGILGKKFDKRGFCKYISPMARLESPEKRRLPHELVAKFATSLVVEARFISDYDQAIHHGFALVMLEEERRRIFAGLGIPVEKLASERGLVGQVVDGAFQFRGSPIREGEELKVETDVYTSVGPFLVFHHKASRPNTAGVVMEVIADMVVMKRGEAGKYDMVPLPSDVVEVVRKGSATHVNLTQSTF